MESVIIINNEKKKKTMTMTESEIKSAKCDCCGLTEECTQAYITRVQERYEGRWICGLCSEAIKDEIIRSKRDNITSEEAMNRHAKFYQQFKSSSPPLKPTESMIVAVKQLLRRSLDSPRAMRSSSMVTPKGQRQRSVDCASPSSFGRSNSCLSSIDNA